MCSKAISVVNVTELLVEFCQSVEQIYGKQVCTPNMHLHCHLQACLLDYWPSNAFWLFACERLNGILGCIPTNNHDIEVQMMRKFLSSQQVLHSSDETMIQELLHPFNSSKGSLQYEELPELPCNVPLSVNTRKYNANFFPQLKKPV